MVTKFLYFYSFCTTFLYATSDIQSKIDATANKLDTFGEEYKEINSKMAQTAQEILIQEKALLEVQKKLKEIEDELGAKEKEYNENKKRLATLNNSRESLSKEQEEMETDLVLAIARNISLSMFLNDKRVLSEDSLMNEEILRELSEQSKSEVAKLNIKLSENSDKIELLLKESEEIKKVIDVMDVKYTELAKTKKHSEKLLSTFKADKEKYKKAQDKIISQQNSLKKTLKKLNIIKEDEERKIAQEEERKKREQEQAQRAKSTKSTTTAKSENLPDVRNIGSSYQEIKTRPYKGEKTIAPLDGYDIVKKYGTYTDPIYNIKIFNESVSLKPKQKDAKVKNVLNGKVIFAKETALLGNVIIVEHDGGIHTIYANLDKIAPTIQKGVKIKKGSIIGRVNDDLIFEVTQQNYHINPMQLIN